MATFASDLRFALRQLRKVPAFTTTVVLTLALGIGATTAMFSLVEGVLLRPLPFAHPDRLVVLGDHIGNAPQLGITGPEIATYRDATTTFQTQGAYDVATYELSGIAAPEMLHGARLAASVFPTLGVAPLLGRVFTQQEDTSHAPVAVLSYPFWVNRYHRDPHILGTTVTLDRRSFTIVGVMPRSFEFPLTPGRLDQAQIWVPLSLTADELSEEAKSAWAFHIVARLRAGVTEEQASHDAARVAEQVMRDFPPNLKAVHIRGDVRPLRDAVVADARPLLRTLFLAVCIVLLIACANVATLLLVRALRRRREHAVRLALGARAAALLRQSLAEGLVLSVAGGLLGLGCAAALLRVALHRLPESMPRIDAIAMDPVVAGFALLLAILTGVSCSIAPALAAVRTNLLEGLRDDARSSSGSVRQGWLRSALVASEIAIAFVLLTACVAFVRSYQKMLAVDPGFRPDHVLVAGYQLPSSQYGKPGATAAFLHAVVDRLSAQPAVAAVGITNVLPELGGGGSGAYTIEGAPVAGWKLQFAPFTEVYGNYFAAMRIPLLAGRIFTEHDRANAPLVGIVNQSMARHAWPGQNPIGKRLHIGNPSHHLPWVTVVGIVADTRIGAPDQPAGDQWYFPMEQPAIIEGDGATGMLNAPAGYVVLRSSLSPEQMIPVLRSTIASIDPQLALDPVRPMTEAIANVEAPRRFNTGLISAFALAALLLAAMGIYAVVAFSVSQRTQEIAIRMALGAQRGAIARLILSDGARIALLGCGVGVLVALAASRSLRALLFGVSATDPWIYAGCFAAMVSLALLASTLPARRAAAADPAGVLRSV